MTDIRETTQGTCLDHVGFIVPDLAESAALAAALGFTLTVRADHTRTDAQGRTESAGSAQHSIMLRSGYVELMQIVDPAKGHQLASAVQYRHGLHIVAFGTADAVACHAACLASGVEAGPVLYWSRQVQEPDLQGMAQFAYFGSAWSARDPSYLCWVEQRTPGLLRNERLTGHANGVTSLRGLHYTGPRLAAAQWRDRLVAAGLSCQAMGSDGWRLALADATFELRIDETRPSVLPRAVVFGGADLAWLRARCDSLGVAHRTDVDGALALDLTAQWGLHWRFEPDTATTST